jgi:hypothetical protein
MKDAETAYVQTLLRENVQLRRALANLLRLWDLGSSAKETEWKIAVHSASLMNVDRTQAFDRLSALLGVDAPSAMMADIAADEIERLRAAMPSGAETTK